MAWLKKIFLNAWIQRQLDKIPLNGRKTYVALILAILGVAIKAIGEGTPVGSVLAMIYNALLALDGVAIIQDPVVLEIITSSVMAVIFAYHKVLKLVFKKKGEPSIEAAK